jgi:Peptidase S24-like
VYGRKTVSGGPMSECWQTRGLVVQVLRAVSMWNDRHGTDAEIENYAWFLLKGSDLESLEEHLLVCEACRVRVSVEDRVREMFLLGQTRGEAERSRVIMIDAGGHRARVAARILHFRTHLPLYSLEAAAGSTGRQITEIEPEGWVEVTPGPIRLTRDMFVTHIKGSSMEPLIPDGSLCAFRSDVSEPYDGRILLMEDYGEVGGNRYAVKRYRVSGKADPTGKGDLRWLHERFTLESLNTDFAPMDIASARKVNVIGEFVFTLPGEMPGR